MADFKTPYSLRLCFSGGENRRILDSFKEFNIKHILLSFYYIKRTFHDPQDLEKYLDGFTTVIIDSGTIYGNLKNEREKTDFLNSYRDFIEHLDKKSFTAAIAEKGLDLDQVLPDEALIYPYDDLKEVFEDDVQSMCKHIKYIGVSASKMRSKRSSELERIFSQARKEGTYVHAFATSSRRVLNLYPYYSANTSSWRSGSRYLNTYIYEGQGRSLRIYQPTDKKDTLKTEGELKRIRSRQKLFVEKRQPELASLVNFDQVLDGDAWEVDKANLTQWMMYQEELGLQPQGKYYLVDNDREDILHRKRLLLGKFRDTEPKEESDMKDAPIVEDSAPKEAENPEPVLEGEIIEELSTKDPQHDLTLGTAIERRNIAPPAKEARARITPVDTRMKEVRQCDFCILADRCPKYRAEGLCAYGLPPESPTYDHNRLDEIAEENLADLMAITMDRIQMAYLQEKLDGTGLNKDLTNLVKMYGELRALAKEAGAGERVSIDARGPGVLDMFKGGR